MAYKEAPVTTQGQVHITEEYKHSTVFSESITAESVIDMLESNKRKRNIISPFVVFDLTDDRIILNEVYKWYKQNDQMSRRKFDSLQNSWKASKELGGRLFDSGTELVKAFTEANNIRLTYSEQIKHDTLYIDGKKISKEQFDDLDTEMQTFVRVKNKITLNFHNLYCKLFEFSRKYNLSFGKEDIMVGIELWSQEMKNQAKEDIYLKIRHNPAYAIRFEQQWEDAWMRFAGAYCRHKNDYPLFIGVMKKFIWQVKRKIAGLKVTDHLMPVLTGEQGGGKSSLVLSFINPVIDATSFPDFMEITDNRNIQIWDQYVLFIDEMQKSTKADIGKLKNLITTSELTLRPMFTNKSSRIINNATFIGTANDDIESLISDPTGMRRFIQLKARNKLDWEVINSTDFVELWRSINEHKPDPSLSVMDIIKERQEESRDKDPVELWLEDEGLEVLRKSSSANGMKVKEYFGLYAEWEKAAHYTVVKGLSKWRKMMDQMIDREAINVEKIERSGYKWYRFTGIIGE